MDGVENLSVEQLLQLVDLTRLPLALMLLGSGWLALVVGVRVLDDLGERFTERRLLLKKTKALLRFSIYLTLTILVPLTLLADAGLAAIVPMLATLGFGLGFALKDLAASLMAGVLLLIDEPFQVGDRIAFGGFYGEVTEIGLRSVRLVTLDDNLVTIPNSRFLTESVASANAGALDCMVVVPFYVAAHADGARVRRLLAEVAATSPYVFLDKPIATVVQDEIVADLHVTVVNLKAYVFDARYEKAFQTDVVLRGKGAFAAEGIPLPSREEHVEIEMA